MKSRIMYIELKQADHNDNGPARIGRVTFSKTGKTICYKGRAFESLKGTGICANYFDVASGKVEIDGDVREEYFRDIRGR